ncbi:MAG: hypothetical protein JWP11_2708 [Frankiales bacterium]|nr:hypothetical protein [Frankiales bacterium]
MKRLTSLLVGVVVLALVAFVGWRVFEHFDQQDKIKNANKSCDTFDVVKGTPTLPSGFTLPSGQKLLNVQTTGKTSVIFASLPGSRDDLVSIRDSVEHALVANGYKVTGGDQEPTFEADGTVSKNGVDDTINVRPLCSGRAVVRYTVH